MTIAIVLTIVLVLVIGLVLASNKDKENKYIRKATDQRYNITQRIAASGNVDALTALYGTVTLKAHIAHLSAKNAASTLTLYPTEIQDLYQGGEVQAYDNL